MKILGTTSALINPPLPRRRTSISALLDAIAESLNSDGATVEPDSIDTSGLSIVVDNRMYRLELIEEVLDAAAAVEAVEESMTDEFSAEWHGRQQRAFERWMDCREARTETPDDDGPEMPF